MAAEEFYMLCIGEYLFCHLLSPGQSTEGQCIVWVGGFPGFRETNAVCSSDIVEYAEALHGYLSRFEKKILLLTIIYHKSYNKEKIKKFKRSESIISGKAGDSHENDRIRT